MAKVHMILQGKGGVGKSFVASTIAQYLVNHGSKPLCIDTDPINATFAGYASLDVKRLEILENNEINSRKFDTLVELIARAEEPVIIDNGASSFSQLSNYLISSDVANLVLSMSHELVLHTVVTGGQALRDTLIGLDSLCTQFPEGVPIVVWLNPYWGPIEAEGKSFEQMRAYKEHKARIAAVVKIPDLKEETFGRDLSELLQERKTFKEGLDDGALTIMTRQRLKIVRDQLFMALEASRAV